MALLDDLADDKNFGTRTGPRCSACATLAKLPKDDQKALTARLADDGTTSAALARVLRANGFNVSGHTLARHRKGDCRNGA